MQEKLEKDCVYGKLVEVAYRGNYPSNCRILYLYLIKFNLLAAIALMYVQLHRVTKVVADHGSEVSG